MKRFLQVFLFAFYLPVVSAQVYTITEAQLQKLEANLTSLELSKRSLQEQAKESESRARSLREESESLTRQLREQVSITTQLEGSLTKYEEENNQLRNELELTRAQLHKERLKNKELLNVIGGLCGLIIVFVAVFGIAIYFKSKNVIKLLK